MSAASEQTTKGATDVDIERIDTAMEPQTAVKGLSLDEKISLVSGYGLWRTTPVEHAGVSSIVMADGPNGLRYSKAQADESPKSGGDFSDFIGLVTKRGQVTTTARPPEPATCFPTASTVGTTWDPRRAQELGETFARECAFFGISVLLGPGMNIRRTPLGGRSSEYYSEDPLVTGAMAAAVVTGLQSNGVGACIKHFAANNSEIERTSMDSVVDERALRDIYLRGFERVIADAEPWAVMSSYNRLNGTQTSHDPWLLTEVLRDEWGYDGLVISDWHGITDRPASLLAGNDLDMPQSAQRVARLRAAVADGRVSEADLDRAAGRVAELATRADAVRRPPLPFDSDAHHSFARTVAREGTVLLANNGVLPLSTDAVQRILVIGAGGVEPVIQGFGSARMTPTRIDIPFEEITARAGSSRVRHLTGVDETGRVSPEAVTAASEADVVVVFAHTDQNRDGENADRVDLQLAPGYDELITAVAANTSETVVVLTIPDAVQMPWLSAVSAVLVPFYAGQGMGGAVADLLFGESSPSGKLTTTFPVRQEDLPSFLGYPGEGSRHVYVEGPFVGYRGFDLRGVAPLFPFGFGLSYTAFELSDIEVTAPEIVTGGTVSVRARLRNTGGRAGAEVVQVYASAQNARVRTAPRELVGFTKVWLDAGEEQSVEIEVRVDDLAHWNVHRGRRLLDDGIVLLGVGTSSRDIVADAPITVSSGAPMWRPLRRDTETSFVLANPHARAEIGNMIADVAEIEPTEADQLLRSCAKSFVNVFDTLANRLQLAFEEDDIAALIERVAIAERASLHDGEVDRAL